MHQQSVAGQEGGGNPLYCYLSFSPSLYSYGVTVSVDMVVCVRVCVWQDIEDLEARDYKNMENPSLLRFLVDMRGEDTTNTQLRDDLITMLIAGLSLSLTHPLSLPCPAAPRTLTYIYSHQLLTHALTSHPCLHSNHRLALT